MYRSGNSLYTLDFIHFWKPFVRIFQLLGITHYGIFRPELNTQRLKLNLFRLFFIVNVAIQITCVGLYAVAWTRQLQSLDKFSISPIYLFFNIITRCSQLLISAVVPFETVFKRHTEQKLFNTFLRIDELFKDKLKHVIDYRVYCRRQMLTTWLYFIVMTTTMLFSFVTVDPFYRPRTLMGFIFFFYILVSWHIRIFQVAFYINMLKELLLELKTVARRQQHRIKYNSARWKDIQYCRQIYSDIWFLRTLIDDCFGYSMILFVADSAVQIMNSAYWLYLTFETFNSNSLHIR